MLEPRRHDSFAFRFLPPEQREPASMWAHWLVRLRWVAIAAQATVVAFFWRVIDSPALSLTTIGVVLAVLASANASTVRRLESEVAPTELLLQLWLDVLALTVVLMLCGGTANPFAMLLLLHVALGVIVLSRGQAAVLVATIVGCFGLLQLASLPLHLEAHLIDADLLASAGPLVAFSIPAVTLGAFLRGMVRSLRVNDARSRIPEEFDDMAPNDRGQIAVP